MPGILAFMSAEEATAAQDVHAAATALNRALGDAHRLGLWIDLTHEAAGMATRYPAHGGGYIEVKGSPPSVKADVALRLPSEEKPDA